MNNNLDPARLAQVTSDDIANETQITLFELDCCVASNDVAKAFALVDRIALLPTAVWGAQRSKLLAKFGSGLCVKQLDKAIAEEQSRLLAYGHGRGNHNHDSLPRVCVSGRQLREISDEALAALQIANNPPVLFGRGNVMVSVVKDEKQRQVISDVTEAALRGWLSRTANYFRITPAGREVACAPPIEVVRDILSLAPANWKFLPLDAIAEAPVLRPDGTVVETLGYDPATQLYYAPDPDLRVPAIPGKPAPEDIDAALELIGQVLIGFPFADSDRKNCPSLANAIAAMLTPIIKPAINAPTPMVLIDAPQAGTGKSLLADVISIIVTGRPGEMLSAPREADEWRKQITTALLGGTSVVVIDNICRKLDSPELAKVLTETLHSDRALGSHRKLLLPVKTTFIATGNNIQVSGDLPRRCYWVRLDAQTSRPFERTGFRIADLKGWVAANRAQLLAALLTLARAWYAAGRPAPQRAPLGSYEAWSVTVGGVLEFCGVNGFLANSHELYEEADTDSMQWEGFLLTLNEVFYAEAFTIAQLVEKLKAKTWNGHQSEPTEQATNLRAAIPDFLVELVDNDGSFRRRAGRCFGERVGKRFGESQVHLKRCEVTHKVQLWMVITPNPKQPGG